MSCANRRFIVSILLSSISVNCFVSGLSVETLHKVGKKRAISDTLFCNANISQRKFVPRTVLSEITQAIPVQDSSSSVCHRNYGVKLGKDEVEGRKSTVAKIVFAGFQGKFPVTHTSIAN